MDRQILLDKVIWAEVAVPDAAAEMLVAVSAAQAAASDAHDVAGYLVALFVPAAGTLDVDIQPLNLELNSDEGLVGQTNTDSCGTMTHAYGAGHHQWL